MTSTYVRERMNTVVYVLPPITLRAARGLARRRNSSPTKPCATTTTFVHATVSEDDEPRVVACVAAAVLTDTVYVKDFKVCCEAIR